MRKEMKWDGMKWRRSEMGTCERKRDTTERDPLIYHGNCHVQSTGCCESIKAKIF
jgi:hypothetical protein